MCVEKSYPVSTAKDFYEKKKSYNFREQEEGKNIIYLFYLHLRPMTM